MTTRTIPATLASRGLAFALLTSAILALPTLARAADVEVVVDAGHPGHAISPRLTGIFFEDINFGGDGGLNAELVKNGSFEFPQPMMGWSELTKRGLAGARNVLDDAPRFAANPSYLRLEAQDGAGGYGVANEGFRGMGVRAGETYRFSAWTRSTAGATAPLEVRIVAPDGKVLAEAHVAITGSEWKLREADLQASATEPNAHLELSTAPRSLTDLDMVSLCPEKTWKGRPHGLRADLVQSLADLHPAFMRFPGGCIVEGSQLKYRYQWKQTIGELADRRLLIDRWNYEFKHRPTPDYFQSFALGFFEYFQMCEDIGAEPLPILNCGMACQFNSSELVSLDELDPFIQDAIDLIEFANGPATSGWGAKRAAMGRPEPFKMRLLGIGNEQWDQQYFDRYARFAKAIKERYPEVKLVSSAGPSPGDDRFHRAWKFLREAKADIVDEHSYAMPDWFLDAAHRFDDYDRSGPKVFMGEYAAQSVGVVSPDNHNSLECALGEAAFMTGLERNSDVVVMSSYAPLFAHVDAWQWRPNLIWFDNLNVVRSANYYVQQLFSRNRGDVVLPVTIKDDRPKPPAAGRIGLATFHTAAEFKDLSVKAGDKTLLEGGIAGDAWDHTVFGGKWKAAGGILSQTDATAVNPAQTWLGDCGWADYTLTLSARKLSGDEGFIIVFRGGEGGSQLQWNLGGWGNKQHGIQANFGGKESILVQTPGEIEKDRWYKIRIELKGQHVDCYLDDKLVHSLDVPPPAFDRLYAAASQDRDTGDLILKVVNPQGQTAEASVKLRGATIASGGREIVLSGKPDDENLLETPDKVAPVERELTGGASEMTRTFPPYSLTVLRLKGKAPAN